MQFGLITEGITDQLVIETIINSIINSDEDKATVDPLSPMSDEPAGYTKVFSYIQSNDLKEALKGKDYYVVIHIDTDTTGLWSEYFKGNKAALELLKSIPVVSGSDKDRADEIIANVIKLFRLLIGEEYYDAHSDKIIPAIAINEMECWILPFHAQSNSDFEKMVQCLGTLNKLLSPKGYSIAPDSKASNNRKYYLAAIKDINKRKNILEKYHLFPDTILA
jgi:hypothetical protein